MQSTGPRLFSERACCYRAYRTLNDSVFISTPEELYEKHIIIYLVCLVPCNYISGLQVLNIEFILLWCTYLAIMFTNLEAGIAIGFVLATMYFAFSYARVCSTPCC